MNRRVDFRVEAAVDFTDAARWYNDRRRGLGDEFEQCVQQALDSIQYMPESFPVVFQAVRQGLVSRFPYSVLFEFDDERILVIAIQHLRRNPAVWMRRA